METARPPTGSTAAKNALRPRSKPTSEREGFEIDGTAHAPDVAGLTDDGYELHMGCATASCVM